MSKADDNECVKEYCSQNAFLFYTAADVKRPGDSPLPIVDCAHLFQQVEQIASAHEGKSFRKVDEGNVHTAVFFVLDISLAAVGLRIACLL